MENLADSMVNKSVEAFVLGIELYNKPTIKYRVEGFSFFICNSWELMLKAHLIKTQGMESIYYKDNNERTITLENCIKKIFTNKKDPLRLNLEKIVALRNTSTHFITEEYEMVYIPLFQACVNNFSEKILDYHGFDTSTVISQNFLNLTVTMNAIDDYQIKAKYPPNIALKLINSKNEIEELNEVTNERFGFTIIHEHYITKNKNQATSFVGIDNSGNNENIQIVKELKDPQKTYPYSAGKVVENIKKSLSRLGIELNINLHVFQMFLKYYDMKENETFCYKFFQSEKTTLFRYSQRTIDFIVDEIKKDPQNIIIVLKEKVKKK